LAYQVLARKWRPQSFSELVGQEQVLSALVHSLGVGKLHHAYLFTGTRGVGKTTVARIAAKCFNCEKGISATPCGACPTCIEISEGRFIDLIEIDAASRTKVEDTREILDNIQYAPSKGRFKVYLIDEVHMLSTHSFNALLKTLEEPPDHVKFLLATTDPHKLPVTVLSRCLQFHLKHIPNHLIKARLEFILGEEKIQFESAALDLIATAAEGSLRDALSLLDQGINQGEGCVSTTKTAEMLGMTETHLLYELAEAIAAQSTESLFNLIKKIEATPIDYGILLNLFTELWYEVSLAQQWPNYQSLDWQSDRIHHLAGMTSPTLCQLLYQMALQGKKDLPFAPQPKIGFNMTLLRMLAFQPLKIEESQPHLLKKKVTPALNNTAPLSKPNIAANETKITEENWKETVNSLPLAGVSKQFALNMSFIKQEGQALFLNLSHEHQSLLNPKLVERLQNAFSEYYQTPFTLQISVTETPLNTPAMQQQKEIVASQNQLQEKLDQDPHLSFIKNNFNVIIDSVKSIKT
jgi:DNA polymerase-3 subunit gamma/tau